MKTSYLIYSGIMIWILAAVYAHIETKFFAIDGVSNLTPASAEEAICDGIVIIIVSLGLLTFGLGMALKSRKAP